MSAKSSIERYLAELEGKVVIITGAASGLGKHLAETLGQNNMRLFLVDVNPRVQQVSDKLADSSWHCIDLCQPDAFETCFNKAVSTFGHVDIVVNNAGIANERSLFSQEDGRELDRIVDLNLKAPMEACRVAVRYFKENKKQGIILNTASVGGLMPISLMESYGTTKAGLIFFTASCKSLAPLIRVNAVAPYFADTPLVANNRLVRSYPLVQQIGLMKPEKVIKTMIKALGDKTLAGDTLMIAMGAKAEKLTFYDDLTMHVTSYITNGTINKYAASFSSYFSRALNSILGYLRNPVAQEQE